jgi:hypothetical protein
MSRSVTAAAGGAVAVVLSAGALAACGPAVSHPSRPQAASASPAPATAGASASQATAGASPTAPATAPAQPCGTSKLGIAVDVKQAGAAAGSAYYPIDFTNRASVPCTLFGYPGVSFVTRRDGSELGSPAARNSAAPAAKVTLPPGGQAHALLQVVDAGNYSTADCRPVTAHWLRVYPPGQTRPVYAPFTVRVCAGRMPARLGNPLAVYPIRSGKGELGQAP